MSILIALVSRAVAALRPPTPGRHAADHHAGADEAYADLLHTLTAEPATPAQPEPYTPAAVPVELSSLTAWTAATTDTALMDLSEVTAR